jgi:Xaa-Pro aminopeptidase
MDERALYADFPQAEYLDRWDRARGRMRAEGIDALLITEEKNYIYFTGHRSQQNPIDKIRPYLFVLPLEGRPVAIVMPFEEGFVRLGTWVEEVRTYDLRRHLEVVVATLTELGLAEARIGAELGREQYLEITHHDFLELERRLPRARFVDAAEILLGLRVVKSPAEVALCRAAAEMTARAMERTFPALREGMTEREAARILRTTLMDEGAEAITFLDIGAGTDFSRGRITCATDRRLQRGDTLTIDTGIEVKGYCSDVTRMAIVGRPSREQLDMYRTMLEVQRACFAALRPGNRAEDAMKVCREELARRDLRTQMVGRIGHGVGLESTEYPSLGLGETIVLEPGMIFACNPNYVTAIGYFNSEENLVITPEGNDLLSRPGARDEVVVI